MLHRTYFRPLAIICWFVGHWNVMHAPPEETHGLYAYSWIGCGRCGRTDGGTR